MRAIAAGILVSFVCSGPLLAQDQDRSLGRMSLTLQQPSPMVRGVVPAGNDWPKLGIFTLAPPVLRGEMIRVSVPIGELVTGAFKGVAAANQRRQQTAARRKVESALKRFAEQQQ